MNRRSFLLSSAGAAALAVGPRVGLAQSATPGAASFPTLEIVVHDDGYTLPATIPAGRTLVTISNKGTQGSHTSLGIVPAGVTKAELLAANDESDPNAPAPDWFWKTNW